MKRIYEAPELNLILVSHELIRTSGLEGSEMGDGNSVEWGDLF